MTASKRLWVAVGVQVNGCTVQRPLLGEANNNIWDVILDQSMNEVFRHRKYTLYSTFVMIYEWKTPSH